MSPPAPDHRASPPSASTHMERKIRAPPPLALPLAAHPHASTSALRALRTPSPEANARTSTARAGIEPPIRRRSSPRRTQDLRAPGLWGLALASTPPRSDGSGESGAVRSRSGVRRSSKSSARSGLRSASHYPALSSSASARRECSRRRPLSGAWTRGSSRCLTTFFGGAPGSPS